MADNIFDSTPNIEGKVASDAVDAGNPIKMGYHASSFGSAPTNVAAADRVDALASREGIPFYLGGHPNIVTEEFHFTAAQTNAALVTVSAGTIIVVTGIDATVDNATTPDVAVRIGFATATLTAVSGSGITGIVLSHPGIAPGSGIVKGSASGIIGIGASNEDLRLTSEVPTGGALRILVTYYTVTN